MIKNQLSLIFVSLLMFTMVTSCNSQMQASQINDKILSNQSEEEKRPQPNVIILLADDLGWQDVKCYDIDEPSPYETPNIDALAKEGVMFWQGYSPAPTCAPSRCAIMSGNHPARAQKTNVLGGHPPTAFKSSTSRMMEPWFSGRMPANEMTIPRALKANNYVTGHSGKWHMALGHHSFPQPADQGFDFTRSNRGVTRRIKPDRLSEFATDNSNDKYVLDENGFAFNEQTQDAIDFMEQSKEQPFFLYYAEWFVHAPIQTRNRRLLQKYVDKLGAEFPTTPGDWEMKGQNNPYYCSMVEDFDYRVGQVVNYLKTTDDPRWSGHKLFENTYFIFTSDNGGAEKKGKEIITDNYPLDRGKKSPKEGGTRVPLIITGPGIKAGVQSDVMINGLDFYPTILALTETKKPAGKTLDGCDISELLLNDVTDSKLVKHENGKERTSMMWHFPNGELQSTIRNESYKLIKNYDHVENPEMEEFELYQLYAESGKSDRVDIEEAKNLAAEKPELVSKLHKKMTAELTEMKASYPYYNPFFEGDIPNKETVPTVQSNKQDGNKVIFMYTENGAKVVTAHLLYTLNGGEKPEEWFQATANLTKNNTAEAMLPEGTTHYLINLIDENNFLVSYPEMKDAKALKKSKGKYSDDALTPVK